MRNMTIVILIYIWDEIYITIRSEARLGHWKGEQQPCPARPLSDTTGTPSVIQVGRVCEGPPSPSSYFPIYLSIFLLVYFFVLF